MRIGDIHHPSFPGRALLRAAQTTTSVTFRLYHYCDQRNVTIRCQNRIESDHADWLGWFGAGSPRQTTPVNDFSGEQLGDYGWFANSSGPGNAPCGNAFRGIATRLPWTTSVSIATAPDVWPAAVAPAV